MPVDSYKKAGVDIAAGDAFADFIRDLPSKAVSKAIGGFAGGVPLDLSGWKEPMLLSTTDGVGTKLLVAKKLGRWDSIGIDLVAMSVNDLAVCGADPISFLDYIACGRIREEVLRDVIRGVVAGCEQADCVLAGGETAEMPDVYGPDDLDLAGFCVGVVEKSGMLPLLSRIEAGDAVLGLPSSGVHSNGYSLARKCVPEDDRTAWEELLTPTRIYVRELRLLRETGKLLAAAHITGSGLEANFERVIPKSLKARFTWDWPRPGIFDRIQRGGNVPEEEMRRVFNLGVGIAFVVKPADADSTLALCRDRGIPCFPLGELVRA
ncbi:MAG TPA: phosphoribosylformylglycinamidine cyclo-ligase [Spirochaetia bacterium]|nr:phosphoribosylformylglycinamidine cyclo-ligase [Spirochaetales bacterium]HRY80602.1 phosphoribosylformylglycinamidine cyclo-ligase [Spirochaetia bacterium]